MITFRHHVISLAAVFVALAIGVVLGAGAFSGPLASGLRGDKGDLQQQISALNDEKTALNQRLSAAGDFDTKMAVRIVRDALTGKSVVLFRTPDAVDDDVDAVTRLIGQAGGSVTGTIALLILAVLLAVVAALWVSRADTVVIDWITNYWNHFSLWVQSLVT